MRHNKQVILSKFTSQKPQATKKQSENLWTTLKMIYVEYMIRNLWFFHAEIEITNFLVL